jgi:hypothetical protein
MSGRREVPPGRAMEGLIWVVNLAKRINDIFKKCHFVKKTGHRFGPFIFCPEIGKKAIDFSGLGAYGIGYRYLFGIFFANLNLEYPAFSLPP